MVSIGILEAGTPPGELAAQHGRYDAMVARLLGDGAACRTYDTQGGELPTRPEDHAGYVITGSSAGVYDPLLWIEPLKEFIRAARDRSKLVGLCFGHQIMAEALGGHVERSPNGWGLGLHRYEVMQARPWMDDAGTVAAPASHQDQVVVLPPGAAVIARSAFTPFAALSYGDAAMSVQFHPEFTHDFATALVERRRDALTREFAASALDSLKQAGDGARVGAWIRRFLGVTG